MSRSIAILDKALELIARLLLEPGFHKPLETHKVLIHDAN